MMRGLKFAVYIAAITDRSKERPGTTWEVENLNINSRLAAV
jgi:hypothetical protein